MGGPSFPGEDQSDADFFDKLVDDEVVDALSEPTFPDIVESSDLQAFAKLSVDEVGTSFGDGVDYLDGLEGEVGEKGNRDDVFSSKNDAVGKRKAEDGGDEIIGLSESLDLKNDPDSGGHDMGAETANAGAGTTNAGAATANLVGGIKEMQWSAFGGTGGASNSDIFNLGDDSADPFEEMASGFGVISVTSAGSSGAPLGETDGGLVVTSSSSVGVSPGQVFFSSSYSVPQNEDTVQQAASTIDHATGLQEHNSTQYWDNLYPGWRFDPNTGQWYQVDNLGATVNNTEDCNTSAQSTSERSAAEQQDDVYYLQQTAQSVAGTVSGQSSTGNLSYWNQTGQGSVDYPVHVVFDPQYPGWYYDTIAQEWRSVDSHIPSINHSTSLNNGQSIGSGSVTTNNYYSDQNTAYVLADQGNSNSHQQDQVMNWRANEENLCYRDMNVAQSANNAGSFNNANMSNGHVSYSSEKGQCSTDRLALYGQPSKVFDSNGINGFQGYSNDPTGYHKLTPEGKSFHQNSNCSLEYNRQFSTSYLNGPQAVNFSQQTFQSGREVSFSSSEKRSSAGRPAHALVTFGFGGKLIVMKDQSTLHAQPAYESQDSAGGVINVLNLMEVAVQKSDGANIGFFASDYFHSLCHQSFPGPLVSNNVGSRELNRWIDDRIALCDSTDADLKKGEDLKMLFSLLKIACQYYGRLRSGFGADHGLKENDCPESALAKLFASGKGDAAHFSAAQCLQNLPSEGEILATAGEVQMHLVSGKKIEALQCAQQGRLWGLAIVIAALLGEQYYGETVKQMALHQLVAGSPLRTLCLLLAGQPAEVFSNLVANNPQSGLGSQIPQVGPSFMLDGWEENLAIISANKTKGDELVITHLGDCLWRERSEVMAAHICYLVAEVNIEPYSESARLCLVGADHLKYPRTFAGPQAIQRTELYEYAKVLGNSQFILMPFQPYKLIYACMLAEVGKLTDSQKYCQSVLKSLKAGRSVEVDACRVMVSSLEERIKIHQQGGYATNLAPAKLVGRLLNFFDNTAHRVVGGLPPPIPSASHTRSELDHQSRGPRVSTSQSTMTMSSLIPSATTEGNTRKSLHNRSVSEPDIGRTPRKAESPGKSSSTSPHDNSSVSASRFGRFGSQIFQKTVGLVLRSRSDRQAKLGDKNKFYYDEKLKRWVEEGVEPPAEEAALAPPPTIAAFTNGALDRDNNDESLNVKKHGNGSFEYISSNYVEKHAGASPIPSVSNHFSAAGRTGARARYVDTFNKGGGTQAKPFNSPSPSIPVTKPVASNAKFFIPTPVAIGQEHDSDLSSPGTVVSNEDISTPNGHLSFSSPQMFTSSPIHRHPSMELISNKGMTSMLNGNGTLPPHSRRTLSWSGGLGDAANQIGVGEIRPLGEALGFPPSTYMSGSASAAQFSSNCTTVAEDVQEVYL